MRHYTTARPCVCVCVCVCVGVCVCVCARARVRVRARKSSLNAEGSTRSVLGWCSLTAKVDAGMVKVCSPWCDVLGECDSVYRIIVEPPADSTGAAPLCCSSAAGQS